MASARDVLLEVKFLLELGVDAVLGVDESVEVDWSAQGRDTPGDFDQALEYLVPTYQAISRRTGAGAPVRYRRFVYLLRWDVYTTAGDERAAELLSPVEPIFEDSDPHEMWISELTEPISAESWNGSHYRSSLLVRATRQSLES